MGLMRAVLDIARVVWILRGFQEVVKKPDGVIEIVGIARADFHVYLADQLGAKRFPITLKNVAQIEMFAPVVSDRVINHAGGGIPDALRVTIAAHGTVDRLPDAELVRGAAMVAKHLL